MAAIIEGMWSSTPHHKYGYATYEHPWCFPLEDTETGEKSLLIIKCTPESLITQFFATKALRKFPVPITNEALLGYCNDKVLVAEIGPDTPYLTKEYSDLEVGSFTMAISYAKDGFDQKSALQKKIAGLTATPDKYDTLLNRMPRQATTTLL